MAVVVGVAAALAAPGCARPRRDFSRSPVILVSIDTLRADHLPVYGYRGVRTPGIDALARDSILYTNAVSHVPLTLPSHASMMTGLLPFQNGVRDNEGYVLAPTHETLASRLRGRGYATGAAVSAFVLAAATQISRGFDFYDDHFEAGGAATLGDVQRSGFETEKIAESWITAHRGRPFFFFLHLYEPHAPYAPVSPFDRIYRDRPYDGEIATADQIVGSFFAFLKSERLYDPSLILLVSDHGEGLGDHGEAEHGILLYRESLHIPMMLKLPGGRGGGQSVDQPVGLVDLYPTVLRLLGIPAPPNLAGKPLPVDRATARSFPVRDIYSETLYPRYHFGWSDLAALTSDRFELIHAPQDELYDFVADPAERQDLATRLPPAFRRLRNALLAMDRPRQAPGAADPEKVKKLAALGYLGSASAPAGAEDLPNPMAHISEIEALHRAAALRAGGRLAEAAAVLEELVRRSPAMADAWIDLGNAYRDLGFPERALGALREADRRVPGNGRTMTSLSNAFLDLGDATQAGIWAERAVAANGPAEAHEVLGAVRLREGRLPEAEKEARTALAASGRGSAKPEMLLAQIQEARGDLSGALATLQSVESREAGKSVSSPRSLHYLKGDVLARLGRNADAESELEREIRDFPADPPAWTALAVLYASEGRSPEARDVLLKLARTVPTSRAARAVSECFAILGDRSEAAHWKALADERLRAAGPRGPRP